MINALFDRFNLKMIDFIENNNMDGSLVMERNLNELVMNFSEVEECTMNMVVASKFLSGNEMTYVIVLNIIDEINHKIVTRINNLRISLS